MSGPCRPATQPPSHPATQPTTLSRAGAPEGLDPLTPRGLAVLHGLSKAKAGIGMVLGIGVCTVRVQIRNIVNKLPANKRTHAAARAMQLGLAGRWGRMVASARGPPFLLRA